MSGIPSLTILPEEQKFNGDNLPQWNTNINQLLGSKGLLGYIDGSVQKPGPETVPLPSTTPEGTVISAQPQATTTSTPIYSLHLLLTNGSSETGLPEAILRLIVRMSPA